MKRYGEKYGAHALPVVLLKQNRSLSSLPFFVVALIVNVNMVLNVHRNHKAY